MDYQEDARLGALVRARMTRYGAPAALQERIGAALEAAQAPAPPAAEKTRWQKWLPMAAAFACGVIAAVGVTFFHSAADEDEMLAQEVISGHVRSLMANHLADVASSDQHTVKPWFAGKLDFSPPVPDLAGEGFPLVGGRLDYLGQRPVAALVYRHEKHWINVFVWPSRSGLPHSSANLSRQGFNLTGWSEEGMQFQAVSDINGADLQAFAKLMQVRAAQ